MDFATHTRNTLSKQAPGEDSTQVEADMIVFSSKKVKPTISN